jgi:hypothetical protein
MLRQLYILIIVVTIAVPFWGGRSKTVAVNTYHLSVHKLVVVKKRPYSAGADHRIVEHVKDREKIKHSDAHHFVNTFFSATIFKSSEKLLACSSNEAFVTDLHFLFAFRGPPGYSTT